MEKKWEDSFYFLAAIKANRRHSSLMKAAKERELEDKERERENLERIDSFFFLIRKMVKGNEVRSSINLLRNDLLTEFFSNLKMSTPEKDW